MRNPVCYGVLVGSMVDSDDALAGVSMLEQIAGKLDDNDLAVILLANEEDESVLDQEFAKFKTITARFDAAVVAAEVDEARKMEQEMARLARKELRDQKKADRKKKIEDRKAKNAAAFAAFKEKHKKKRIKRRKTAVLPDERIEVPLRQAYNDFKGNRTYSMKGDSVLWENSLSSRRNPAVSDST